MTKRIIPLIAVAAFAATPSFAKPVVLELFTSQGCSSCPPADKVLQEAAKLDGVVAISRPITYWDRLGWKDTLARPENTARQNQYRKLSGRTGVYTPQIVIDGDWEGNGGNRGKVFRQIRKTLAEDTPAEVSLTRASDGRFAIEIRGETSAEMGEVRLISLESAPTVNIGHGENQGRQITYTNVVKEERRVGTWTGGAKRFLIDQAKIDALTGDRLAVVVQRPGLGEVLGAAIISR
ncbi:MAG: DUF1223 domain-containing protein [Pacificimonas sp.]